ncbi:BZ3500_MvSof-1268-A1-R1_Chr6-3g08986 [Microbotryum saponariae]|uniref:BZ3500_MvSof-1268-A1-R1_Chr6-3g08986 protein n=1 Tax=Microbotryum saponariae TaxID=289078 RepID=A0A2X0LQ87_9BASI|nr:BZ3500_MvSof-1268-A1-R1_Chr6-3g08986 [Microbotryum saponariae]SDA07588.1 BZ3501_MvSof-1269-A2-R1_Chr6-2g08690 [Microbotryum saponariae]
MAGHLSFGQSGLKEPYHEIIAGGDTDYALYTLAHPTPSVNELKLVTSGSGGLEELEDEFLDSKAMWAFVRVKDAGSGLPKFVLINWLGEGSPESRKASFRAHSLAVAGFLKGAHISIHARHDADVSPALIRRKVADSSGAKYSIHNEPAQRYVAPKPVSSSYVPIGRPEISHSKPAPPPTPVGTIYQSKANELAEIRAKQAAAASAPKPSFPRDEPSSDAFAPRVVAPVVRAPAFATAPAPPAPAPPKPTPAPVAQAPERAPGGVTYERPEAVGTAYTPVSLPKPGKLANRWGANAASSSPSPSPASYGASPLNPGAGAAQKPLTWSERQALAKKQREEEDEASAAAGQRSLGAVGGATPSSGFRQGGFGAASVPAAPAAPAAPSAPPAPPAPPRAPLAPAAPARPVQQAVDDDDDDFATPSLKRGDSDDEDDIVPVRATPAAPTAPPPPPMAPVAPPPPPVAPQAPPPPPMAPQAPPPPPMAPAATPAPPAPPAPPVPAAPPAPPAPQMKELSLHPSGPQARVLFGYDAEEENELSLVEGTTIYGVEMVDEGWWQATDEEGKQGLFPSNYVELIEQGRGGDEVEREVQPERFAESEIELERELEVRTGDVGTVAIALYDYEEAEEGELSFKEGETIVRIDKVSEEWWQGVNERTGQEGVFPAPYVEVQ